VAVNKLKLCADLVETEQVLYKALKESRESKEFKESKDY
jgi:hypothetical protein